MCGIFCAVEKDKFLELYDLNKERGNFSFGALYDNRTPSVHKTTDLNPEDIPSDAIIYLGHTRAPTIAQDKPFDPD